MTRRRRTTTAAAVAALAVAGCAATPVGGDLAPDAACALLATADLDAVLGGTASPGIPTTSDSGPDGVVGCGWTTSTGTLVTVWLLRRDAAAMYAQQEAAPGEHRPLDVVVDRQTGAVPAGSAERLTLAALPRLP